MMKHKVKYRVVGADRSKRKYSINLDEGASFQLTRELLQGTPAQEGSQPLCSMTIQNGTLLVRAGADQDDVVLNSKPVREAEVRPGDLVQVGEFSIEILECPHTVRNETNATQFLDVSEIFGTGAKASEAAPSPAVSAPASVAEPVSHAISSPVTESTISHTVESANDSITQASQSDLPASTVENSATDSNSVAYSGHNELPALSETPEPSSFSQEQSQVPAQDTSHQDKWASRDWENRSEDSQTRVLTSSSHAPVQSHSATQAHTPDPSAAQPAPAAARVRASLQEKPSERSYEEASVRETQETPARHRSRTSAHRDIERHTTHRQAKRTDAHQPKKRSVESSPTAFTESDFSHIAMSSGMAALGVAASTRILLSGSTSPQGMVVACAALSSIPVVLGMSLGLARMNEYLSAEAHLRDYARFLGWTLICSIPWAYTQGGSFPIAIFTTLLTTVLISVAFVARFRPNMARFSAVGAGLSAVALAALIGQHHYAGDKNVAQETLGTETPATETSTAQNTTPPATAPAPGAPAAPTAGGNTVAQTGNTATAPSAVQPQNPAPAQPGTQPNLAANPVIPSAVNDTIPPIPTRADSLSPSGAAARVPAAVDPSAKGIIDPLAHEEFFSAIKMGNLVVVKSLIDRKQVDPDFTLDKGSTPLIVASASGRIKVVDYLIRRRVNINAQDPHGTTALMWAVFKGHRDVAKYLISKGADTKVIRDDGDTAMDIARKWRQTEIVALLKEASSNQEDGMMHKKSHSKIRKQRRR